MSVKKLQSLEGKIENVELALLNVDETYQRNLKAYHKKIAADFNPAAAGVLCVGRRGDDSLWIIDGQQRREAMLKAGLTKWKAVVLYSSGVQYEALIYKQLNSGTTRKGLTTGELFKGCLAAKDPVAEATVRAVERAGLRYTLHRRGSKGFPELTCIGLLYKMVSRWGEDLVSRGLALVARTWPGQKEVMGEVFPYAVTYLMGYFGDVIDEQRFEEVLSKISPRQILLDIAASGSGTRYGEAIRVMCKYYNKKLRSEKLKLKLLVEDEEVA
jgi:hypothetical protein